MEEKKLLNKVLIFVFLFVTWTILNDGLTTFLGLECVSCFVVYAESESAQIYIENILICTTKIKEGLMGLEQIINDRILMFGWSIPLKHVHTKNSNTY